jgi:hypothetical protein
MGVDEIDAYDLRQRVTGADQNGLCHLCRGVSVELVRPEAGLRNSVDHVAQDGLDRLEGAVRPLLQRKGKARQFAILIVPAHEEQDRADDGCSRREDAERDDHIIRH